MQNFVVNISKHKMDGSGWMMINIPSQTSKNKFSSISVVKEVCSTYFQKQWNFILIQPTLILSVSIAVLAIRIFASSILFGWFTPIFLSRRNPVMKIKDSLNWNPVWSNYCDFSASFSFYSHLNWYMVGGGWWG